MKNAGFPNGKIRYADCNSKLSVLPVKYDFEPDGVSFSIDLHSSNKRDSIRRTSHDGSINIVESDKVFNRGVKRGNTILATGDMPRFALISILPEEKLDPTMVKLGDGRIRIRSGELECWLDEADEIHTVFHPSNTEYAVTFGALPKVELRLVVSQAEDWGAIAKLIVANASVNALELTAEFSYGGIAPCPHSLSAAYFPPDLADAPGNHVRAKNYIGILSDEAFPYQVCIGSVPRQPAAVSDANVKYAFEFLLAPGQTESVYLVAGHSIAEEQFDTLLNQKQPEHWIQEGKQFYERILDACFIRTPNALLDSGFKTALLNHEYVYTAPAWLEGVHFWGAYWNNNFQISAAISLGQLTRAREALELFGARGEGPGCLGSATGKPVINENHQREEWLPYYLNALIQYYERTGDQQFLNQIWDPLVSSIQYLWEARDKNGNHLLDWHFACNPFLYQADHLGMPGDAASPSLMMAGMMAKMSVIAAKIGKEDEARAWNKFAEDMHEKVVEWLWNKDAGVFYNHIDLQGYKHMSHYYTDHVYPALYTSLPQEYAWQSLKYLYDTLWKEDGFGRRSLMRVGSLKPSMFGNDNVMPTQMCEAAHAYFKVGDAEKGLLLLESVALASTVFTEAPGNFPEHMGEDGKGESDYIFGNPIGSFLHSTVAGLFGLTVADEGETVCWSPCFPSAWDDAYIQLSNAVASYKAEWSNSIRNMTYLLRTDTPKKLLFQVHLEAGEIVNISHNGTSPHSLRAGLAKTIVDISCPVSGFHEIEIAYKPYALHIPGPKTCAANGLVSWALPAEVEEVRDLQECLSGLEWKNRDIHAVAVDHIGNHSLFVKLKGVLAYFPLDFEIMPSYTVRFNRSSYDEARRSLFIETQVAVPESGTDDRQLELELLVSKQFGQAKLHIPERLEASIVVEIPYKDQPADGMVAVDYTLKRNNSEVIWSGNDSIHIVGKDEETARQMRLRRDRRTISLDLSQLYNANSMRAASRWRHSGAMHRFHASMLTGGSGLIETPAGSFRLSPKEQIIILVECGYSESYTRDTVFSDKESTVRIPVGMQCSMVSLLYANEVESRHTGAEVGSIRLWYEDGDITLIPMQVGKNVDTMFTHFAEDTYPVEMSGEGFVQDYLNVLQLASDPDKMLGFVEVQVCLPDVHIGIIGVNVLPTLENSKE